MNDLISVIIPVYNVEKYLEKCVNSILNQTYKNIEIILVDDGSLDRSGEICDKLREEDKRISVIHKKKGGLSDARNTGIRKSHGAYLYFIDSDDFVDTQILEKLYSGIIKSKSDMALCDLVYCNEKMENLNDQYHHNQISTAIVSRRKYWELLLQDENAAFIVAWNKLYRRNLFDGIEYPLNKLHEDEFILKDVVERCNSICIVGEALYYYLQRSNSIMGEASVRGDLDKIEALFRRALYFFESDEIWIAEKTLKLGMRYYSALERKLSNSRKRKKQLQTVKDIYDEIAEKFFWNKFSLEMKIKAVIWKINAQTFYQLGQYKRKFIKK